MSKRAMHPLSSCFRYNRSDCEHAVSTRESATQANDMRGTGAMRSPCPQNAHSNSKAEKARSGTNVNPVGAPVTARPSGTLS